MRTVGLRRAPYGARGLKLAGIDAKLVSQGSRPVWGAWIEILCVGFSGNVFSSRPVWGAWIEISPACLQATGTKRSRPVWGAWIEIQSQAGCRVLAASRAPYGARGLKSCRPGHTTNNNVAPRMGRVD